ncbi:tyrosinase family protein, partial [Kribbella sancticallisti]|uniref:tyrosinase family protein n=1 Tax=Kribbella sancticallisti TaxID=460087 RepID=UPI0031E3337A
MALGDGIRRNVASVRPAERALLRDALVELNNRLYPGDRLDSVPGGVTWWFKQDEIHQATHVHGGPEFVPWHRVIVNRFEQLLRAINPQLSLHYWDWTQDPRAITGANMGAGATGTLSLFTPDLMGYGGSVPAAIGEPWLSAGYYVPGADPHRDASGNPADPPLMVMRHIAGTPADPADDSGVVSADDFAQMATRLELVHNAMHGFVSMGGQHISFRDPFVFLLHSNVDRLFALWQTQPGHGERLDPAYVYGSLSSQAALNSNAEPWSTGHSFDQFDNEHFTRPWFAPENDGVPRTYKHPAIVRPPRYDTNVAVHLPPAPDEAGGPTVTSGGPHDLDVLIRGKHNLDLVHRWFAGGHWGGWDNLGGDLAAGPAVTAGGPHDLD